MFSLTSNHRYYYYNGFIDMRKNFDGLCGIVLNQLKRNPASGEVFIFINRTRNKVKLLHWEQGGFVIYYKRLELGTFDLPRLGKNSNCCQVKWSTLVMMIKGISVQQPFAEKEHYIVNKNLYYQQV